MQTPSAIALVGLGVCYSAWLGGCSSPRTQPTAAGCAFGSPARAQCADLPPVPELHFQLHAPEGADDYPYGADSAAPESALPGAAVYLSAQGSADPEGMPVDTFWNVQDPSGAYLAIDPMPSALRASFMAPRVGAYTITLLVTEAGGLRQTRQAALKLDVAPHPCAKDGVSPPCSDSLPVPGGSFLMGSADGIGADNEHPQHPTTVASFALDEYEVSVGRFRRFISGFDPTLPAAGAGAHPLIAGSGWLAAWNANLPGSSSDFKFAISECGGVWTDEIGENEARPVSCITWYEAFAFCVSEGKRLPTEAEWEYAAAGGNEQRLYPWGAETPSTDRAVYGCLFDGVASCSDADLPVVGSVPKGAGRFGQLDLAGSVWEWTLDSYAPYAASACDNCANLGDPSARVFRGGDFRYDDVDVLRAASRYAFDAAFPDQTRGLRCAQE